MDHLSAGSAAPNASGCLRSGGQDQQQEEYGVDRIEIDAQQQHREPSQLVAHMPRAYTLCGKVVTVVSSLGPRPVRARDAPRVTYPRSDPLAGLAAPQESPGRRPYSIGIPIVSPNHRRFNFLRVGRSPTSGAPASQRYLLHHHQLVAARAGNPNIRKSRPHHRRFIHSAQAGAVLDWARAAGDTVKLSLP